MRLPIPLTSAIAGLLFGATAMLAETAAPAQDMMMMMTVPDGASEATRGFIAAMNKMSMAMGTEFTGNADRDFLTGMIGHHQGAVDAAKVVLAFGTDPEVKAFAAQVIAAQEPEIKWMQDWLAKHAAHKVADPLA